MIGRHEVPASSAKARRAKKLARNHRHHRRHTSTREVSIVRTTKMVLIDGVVDVKRRAATRVRSSRRRVIDRLTHYEAVAEIKEHLSIQVEGVRRRDWAVTQSKRLEDSLPLMEELADSHDVPGQDIDEEISPEFLQGLPTGMHLVGEDEEFLDHDELLIAALS